MASHLMGGELTYRYIGNSQYELKFTMYTDCKSRNPDDQILYKIFRHSDSSLVETDSTLLYKLNTVKATCKSFNSYCVREGQYIDTITLGSDTSGYDILYFRTDRNFAIVNLQCCKNSTNPLSCFSPNCYDSTKNPFGMIWHAYIPAQKYENSTPQFPTPAIPFICVNKLSMFDNLAVDPDGDSLVFSLAHPYACNNVCLPYPVPDLKKGVLKVVYAPGYSVNFPFGNTSQQAIIAPQTGYLSLYPKLSGNYVIAVAVKEYRRDKNTGAVHFLGEVRRDMQFIVGSCPAHQNPYFQSDSTSDSSTVKYLQAGKNYCFTVTGLDSASDSLKLQSIGGMLPQYSIFTSPLASYSNTGSIHKTEGSFCWKPSCSQVNEHAPYLLDFRLQDKSCDYTEKTYQLYVVPTQIKSPDPECTGIVKTNDSIKINFANPGYDTSYFHSIKVYRAIGNSAFTLYDSIFNINANTYTDANAPGADSISYRYYFTTLSKCLNESKAGDTINSIPLRVKKVNEFSALLRWTKFVSRTNVKYSIYADTGTKWYLIDTIPDTFYTFRACRGKFAFKIEIEGAICNSYSNISDTFYFKPVLTTPYLIAASVSVPNTEVTVTWTSQKQGTANYKLYRNDTVLASHILIHTGTSATDTVFIDKFQDIDKAYCYDVEYSDYCGNTKISNPGCIMIANAEALDQANKTSVTPYTYWKHGVEKYIVYRKLEPDSWVRIGVVSDTDLTFIDYNLPDSQINNCYRFEAIEKNSDYNAVSYSTQACAKQKPIIWIPNVFTPNGNGLNDAFAPKGAFLDHYEMKIFDRWGEKLFDTQNSKSWNGKDASGKYYQMDVFLYIIIAYGYDEVPHFFSGTITLLR